MKQLALIGMPNTGKSTLFNRLTGSHVETAHYPGKTVALNYGALQFDGKRIGVIDLPGTYALGAISEDQYVARQAVLENPPNAIVAITDATNLERNLYLVLQYLDLGLPLVVAVNLIDEAARAAAGSKPCAPCPAPSPSTNRPTASRSSSAS